VTITFLFVSVLAVTTAIEPAKSGAINQHISKYAVIEYAAPTLRPNREAARAYVTGRDLAASNQHREAISYYLQATELDHTSPAPWLAMAVSLDEISRPDAAFKAWGETLLRDPTNAKALFVLGLDAAMEGNYRKAVQLLSRLRIQENTNTPESTPVDMLLRDVALSTALRRIGDTETGELFRMQIQKFTSLSLSQLLHAQGSIWLSVLQQLVDVGDPSVALQLAQLGIEELDPQRQSTILSALPVIEVAAGGSGEVTLNTFKSVGEHGKIPLRPQWYEPKTLPQALSTAAQSMSSLGSVEASILLYQASVALDSTNLIAVNNLAWSLLEHEGATAEAVTFANRAFELNQTQGFVLDTIGYMKLLQGKKSQAIDLFIEALNASGGDPQILDHLGDAYWQAHQRKDAIDAWQKAYAALRSPEYYQAIVEGYQGVMHSIWGISIATPEALYDLEIGRVVRNLHKKLTAVQEGEDPFEPKKNGVR
jgi:tetratricopeptide (TPR) repeat protein